MRSLNSKHAADFIARAVAALENLHAVADYAYAENIRHCVPVDGDALYAELDGIMHAVRSVGLAYDFETDNRAFSAYHDTRNAIRRAIWYGTDFNTFTE